MIRGIQLAVACVAVLVATAGQANAGIIVDQSQLEDTAYIAAFSQTGLAQSFQQSFDNITGASVKLQGGVGSGVGDITIDLYDSLPNAGGILLGTGTDFGVASGEFAVIDFGSVISVVPDTTLYLVFSSSNSSLGLSGSTSNPYSRGQVFATAYDSFPSYDYTFETFAEVPEPSSLALFGIGACVAGGGAALRRRREKHLEVTA